MGEAFICRRGGENGSLNYAVIAVASEAALPTVGSENTIAVITTSEITSYVFAPFGPSNPTEGMVWFSTGSQSSAAFNAITKIPNALYVYPTACRQYISGQWVTKVAKTWQGVGWKAWEEGEPGGDVKLNYSIAFSDERPSEPTKNTIWIQEGVQTSDIKICLSTAPEAPTDDMLWIEQGIRSQAPFEAVNNSGLIVYPLKTKQYSLSDQAWVFHHAELFDGEKWIDLSIPIYNYGDECTSLSGGWNVSSTSWSTAGSGIPASITKKSDHIYITGNSYKVTGGSGYRLTTLSPIDLTNIDLIGMRISELTGQGMLGVLKSGEKYMDPSACVDVTNASGTTPVDVTKDVSNLTGEYYVCLLMRCTEAKVMTLKAKMHKAWIC